MQINWLRKALRNLEQAYNYTCSQQTPEVANNLVLRIQSAAEQLSNYPMMGRPGRIQGTRELVITQSPYIVVYRVKTNSVEILRVFHGSRQYP
jgi:toxin ParE1/3/4